ncbi:MAG: bifunctional aspartate kinase/homoserine dehydrogenase I [Proteobacteria bacterium]|nr:bifunctional aspartate kinase/homoserine dehydrogenase I [Pseudomonadota bacterium]
MLVQKFGGSSLSTPDKLLSVAKIISNSASAQKVAVVLSAIGKVTDELIRIINTAINAGNWQSQLQALEDFHQKILLELNSTCKSTAQRQQTSIEYLFQEAHAKLQGVALLSQCPQNIHAWLLTIGEQLSVAIMYSQLVSLGHNVAIINARDAIITTEDDLDAEVIMKLTKANLAKYRQANEEILIMAGFAASSLSGLATTLGRNGSDYSAAILAISLKAQKCEIWTDVDGVFNANPNEIHAAYLIPQLSYYEAMELSYFGASVLHPKTITPLMQHNIPCIIRNSFNLTCPGTTISHQPYKSNNFATAISTMHAISMVTVSGPGMQGMVGMAARVFAAISAANISIMLITQSSSEYSISFCINTQNKLIAQECLEATFSLEITNNLLEPINFVDNLAIITLISDNMKKRRGTAAQFFQSLAIANVNIVAIAQGSNERSISAVIAADKTQRGLRSCHQIFFDSRQQVEIILIGCGLVGDAFLQQILKQQNFLTQRNIAVKVCGIVNSKGALLDEHGIDLVNYKELIKSNLQSINRDKLKAFRQQTNMVNPIIVDCTSSQSVAEAYLDFFAAGYHIVAANKKANTLNFDYYQQLKQAAIKNNRQFNYETNVGAGLPVIDTFRNLLLAGDDLLKFEGILSGSMSYIFGKLDDGLALSEAVKQAKDKGFTEPDPRDDLSGMDIARKVLIIAREAGLSLELKDIQIDSLLTKELENCKTNQEFMAMLPNLDAAINKLSQQAQAENSVLRYIGTVQNGKCTVKIAKIASDSALYSVKDGENAISFYSNYYQPIPMVLRGYGAGADVTAAGIFSDIMKILPAKSGFD